MGNISASHKQLTLLDRILLSLLVGIIIFIFAMYFSKISGTGLGDLRYSFGLARDWVSGKDPYLPYMNNIDKFAVPYPFTAVLLTVPIAWLPNNLAAGVFSGIGAGLLAWLILSNGKYWLLLIFTSWPFVNGVLYSQWAPYIVGMFFTPNLMPFLFVKPQIALPFVLTQKPSRIGLILSCVLLVLSVALYPLWPIDWIKTLHNYIGVPLIFVLPLGPLLFLALIQCREKRSWLLVLMALMPQRMVYDQLGVLLVANNRKQMLFLIICSWISLPALIYFGGWDYMPWGWKNWVLIESYFPALIVVLLPTIRHVAALLIGSYTTKRDEFNET